MLIYSAFNIAPKKINVGVKIKNHLARSQHAQETFLQIFFQLRSKKILWHRIVLIGDHYYSNTASFKKRVGTLYSKLKIMHYTVFVVIILRAVTEILFLYCAREVEICLVKPWSKYKMARTQLSNNSLPIVVLLSHH